MARPLRIEFPFAYYHVMNRGLERRNVFLEDEHRYIFLELLGEAVNMFGVEIHAYCLMNNHYHLLLSTPHANLSRAMRHIDGVYTQRFNRSVRRDGALFRGRYKSIIIDADAYMVEVSRYIHLNPVEAKLVEKPAAFSWSSYSAYIDESVRPSWLTVSDVLQRMGIRDRTGGKAYEAFVGNRSTATLSTYYNSNRVSPILGSKAFKRYVLSKVEYGPHPEIPQSRQRVGDSTIPKLLDALEIEFELTRHEILKSHRGRTNIARSTAMYFARYKLGCSLKQIAEEFGCKSYTVVGSAVHKLKAQLGTDPGLREKLESLSRRLPK